LVVRKATISNIIVLLVEGEKIAFESAEKSKLPKNFFELLVKKDWRKWVASVKKELEGWDQNSDFVLRRRINCFGSSVTSNAIG